MSKLGGNSPSADTDKSNNLEGSDGAPGDTPFIQGGTWHIGVVDTGVVAEGTNGTDGVNPNIDGGGNWFIDGVDTGVQAAGEDGLDGEGSGIVVTVEAGTGCTVDATDPTAPIVNVTVVGGGQVDSVVAGTNVDSIDNTDPVNPIINVATQAGDPSPLTTKGDLYGYDTGDERIPVGTNDQVLTADSTAALGLAWKDASGGGGAALVPFSYESQLANAGTSSSNNATKGQWVTIGANSITVLSVGCGMKQSLGSTYRLYIAKEAATANEVESIVATSETLTADASVNMIDEGFCFFPFTATFQLVAGERYFFGVQRTDGTTTAQCQIILVNGPAYGNPDFSLVGYVTQASNTIPAPGFDQGETGTNFHMPMRFNYVRDITTPLPATGIDIAGFISGLIDDAEIALVHQVSKAFTLKAGLAGSGAYSQGVAAATATIDIQKNGSSIGTIDFALGVATATFTFTSDISFAIGDRLLFVGQGTGDTTLADISLTLVGELI